MSGWRVVFIVLLFGLGGACASEAVTVSGYVFETSHCRALVGVTVTLTAPRSSQLGQLVTKTDETGKFTIEYPANGSVYIEVFQGARQVFGRVINLDTDKLPLSIALASLGGQQQRTCGDRPEIFLPDCLSPHFPTPIPRGIDAACGVSGVGTVSGMLKNAVANNFCAGGEPAPVTVAEMVDMQRRTGLDSRVSFGTRTLPPGDRGALRELGEGKQVVLRGFVLTAKQQGAESLNCGRDVPNTPEYHDIHIAIVASPGDSECGAIVIEMSPHHRPISWNAANLNKLRASGSPVRVTGQLFFDSSHSPCVNGEPAPLSPKRASLWEIHPIYEFEVCSRDCEGVGQWMNLDEWAEKH